MKTRFAQICATALALPIVGAAQGQLLFDFESGLQGWTAAGFGNGTEFVGVGATGATGGSAQAMSLGHDSGGFSWDATFAMDGTDAASTALNAALANRVGKAIEFDLTYRANDLPTFVDFANVSFSIQSDDAGFPFRQIDGLGEINVAADGTQTISVPLDAAAFNDITAVGGFGRFTIGLNTNAGRGTSTAYVDNIRIVPEPASAALLGLGGLALTLRRRRA